MQCIILSPREKKGKDEDIARFLGITVRTVEKIREKFVYEGFETALYGKKSERVYTSKEDGDVETHLIALSCGEPPEGYARWSFKIAFEQDGGIKLCG